MAIAKTILITGGMRCGKSRHALALAGAIEGRKVFIATARAEDEEMEARITRHRQERGPDFITVEAPLDLARAVRSCGGETPVILIDCLTLWLYNLLQHGDVSSRQKAIDDFVLCVSRSAVPVIIVTNEVGWGIIPDNALARQFIDELGRLNQRVAAVCQEVILMVAGTPFQVKTPTAFSV